MSSNVASIAAASGGDAESPPCLIPNLPDDVAVNCLARVPRSHHPILSLVSRPFRSLLSSPTLYAARSELGAAEHLLHLSIRRHEHRFAEFFALTRNPHNDRRVLVPLPPVPSPSIGAAVAAAGPRIYVIGGSIHDAPSSSVFVLDCRFNRWETGPKMRVGREFAAAGVAGGEVYVLGGCAVDTWARSAHWAEALDPAERSGGWRAVPSPPELRGRWMHASAVVEGKVYAMADRGGVVFDPLMGSWEVAETNLDMGWRGRAAVVGGLLYCYDYLGKIRGFDVREGVWMEVKGLEKELPRFLCGATMADLGGNLAVVWEEKGGKGREVEIWCAEIEIERRREKDGDLWGRVRWSDRVLSVSKGSSVVHCLSVRL